MTSHSLALRLSALVLLFAILVPAAAAQVTFANTFGGSEDDLVYDVAIDDAGNVYVVGAFERTVDFDPSDPQDEDDTFTAAQANTPDAFVASYAADGAFRWAFPVGGTSTDNLQAVATDGERVYVAGLFQSASLDADPGPGTALITNTGSGADALVAAYTTDGAFVWASPLGGEENEGALALAVGGDRVYAGGFYEAAIDLDPGPGEVIASGTDNLNHVFLAAYGVADGAYEWGFGLPGAVNAFLRGLTADADRVYATGQFNGTVDFDPGSGEAVLVSVPSAPATAPDDAFIAAYGASTGDYVWVGALAGSNGETGSALATDGERLYVGGRFAGDIDLDPGSGEVTRTVAQGDVFDPFVAAYGASDGAYLWDAVLASVEPGSGSEDVKDVALGGDRIYAVGWFNGSVDFDPGAGVETEMAVAFNDAFMVAYDVADGAFVDVGVIGGPANEDAEGVAVDEGRMVVAGRFSTFGTGEADFDPGPGEEPRASQGGFDAFVAAYPIMGEVSVEDGPEVRVFLTAYPNPSAGEGHIQMTVGEAQHIKVVLYDVLGRRIGDLYAGEASAGQLIEAALPGGLASGVYVVQARGQAFVQSLRVTVTR